MTYVSAAGPPGPGSAASKRADEVQVAFGGPAPQTRLSVLIRLFLALPHVVYLWLLGIAAGAVAIGGWFTALFTGEVPADMAGLLTRYLRYQLRVYAYLCLLTEEYPPFTQDDVPYPVRLAVAPGRLNRLAVLLRAFLIIPAWLLCAALGYGLLAASVLNWVILLCLGRLPAAPHQAVCAALRYTCRFNAYWLLLTAAYPGGLFGDRAAAAVPAWNTGAAADQVGDLPGAGQLGTAEITVSDPAPAWPASEPADDGTGPPDRPGAWRLVLSTRAKDLLACLIVGGTLIAAVYVLSWTVPVKPDQRPAQAAALRQLDSARLTLQQSLQSAADKVKACGSDTACLAAEEDASAQAFTRFGGVLAVTSTPGGAAARASLARDTQQAAGQFGRLAASLTRHKPDFALAETVQETVRHFDADYRRLGSALGATSA